MALDGIFLHFLIREIRETALGAKVDKIHQPSKTELLFSMRTRKDSFKLFFSANAESARVNITNLNYDNPKTPPMLCMLLRKRLGISVLTDIRQDNLDRVVFFDFLACNELGDREKLTLVVEIMAQHSNIILIDGNMRIIDAVKRIDETKSSYREILPGVTYTPPPPQNKLNILNNETDEIIKAISIVGEKYTSQAILKVISGVSPLTAREIAFSALGDDPLVSVINAEDAEKLNNKLVSLKNMMERGESKPTVLFSKNKEPYDFSFFDITQYTNFSEKQSSETLSPLLDSFYSERDTIRRLRAKANALYKFVESSLERITKKIALRQAELNECQNRERLKIYAELITANQYKLKKGLPYYEVENYYTGEKSVKIQADPALTPSENAQKYYKEYRKAQTAQQKLSGLLQEANEELEYFESVADALSRAVLEQEVELIRQELATQGYVKNKQKKSQKVSQPDKLPAHQYFTSEGLEVLVGRSNSQNDFLTFKIADKTDWWFHVTKAAGSHVILRTGGKEPGDASVLEAAKLAVKHSSLSKSNKTSVDYSMVKNLKKPNGSKPGFVVYKVYNSIIVD